MKTFFILAATLASIACAIYFSYPLLSKGSNLSNPKNDAAILCNKPGIRVIYFQDFSQSIKYHGIEVVTSEIFEPYFNDFSRNISLNYGSITGNSAHKLVTINLPAPGFRPPSPPELSSTSIVEKKRLTLQYENDLKQYKKDSAAYFALRQARIFQFRKSVDSLAARYGKHLSLGTDLQTAIRVADKCFNYSQIDSCRNFLLLNSDGLDSHHRVVSKMINPATVILINADGVKSTSLDKIVCQSFQSSDEAVSFSLTSKNHTHEKQ